MIADALEVLFDHAKDTLPDSVLDSLADVDDHTRLEAENIGHTLEVMALSNYGNPAGPDTVQMIAALWGLAFRPHALSKMLSIQSETAFLLRAHDAKRRAECGNGVAE